jgi:hypothetical protein
MAERSDHGNWEKIFLRAKLDDESGKFLMQCSGAERHLDLEIVVTLTRLRQQLLEGIENPTASDHMLADTAILAYRNLLRVQGWTGSACLTIERELFGQEPPSSYGTSVGERIEQEVRRLEYD